MRQTLTGLVVYGLSTACAVAGDLVPLPSGQSLTLAGSSNPRTVQIAGANPAAPVTSDLGASWFGLGGVGVGYEVGDFNDLIDDFDQLEEDLERDDLTQAEAEALEARGEAFLGRLGSEAYLKLFASVQPPFLPQGTALSFLGGAVTLGVDGFVGNRIVLTGSNIDICIDDANPDVCNPPTGAPGEEYEITTDAAGYAKAAVGVNVSLGYSGGVHHRDDGSLFVGTRLNYYTVEMARAVVALDGGSDDPDEDTEDSLESETDEVRTRTSALGIDVGALWAAHNFRAGVTVRNLNEPEFDYNPLGDCAGKTGAALRNCNAAVALIAAGRVPAQETYAMERQIQLETAVYTADRVWSLAAAYDVDSVRDAAGDEYQWLSVSGSFAPGGWGWLVPALRAGYRQNQAGSELDMVSVGLSLFRLVNLDVSASTQTIEDDGDEAPRSAMANLSLEFYF